MSNNLTRAERTQKIADILCTPDAKVVEELSRCYLENSEKLGRLESFRFSIGEVYGEISLDTDYSVTVRCVPKINDLYAKREFSIKITEANPEYSGDDEVRFLEPATTLIPNRANAAGSLFPRQQRARVNVVQSCETEGLRIDSFTVMLISRELSNGAPAVVLAQELRDGGERRISFQALT